MCSTVINFIPTEYMLNQRCLLHVMYLSSHYEDLIEKDMFLSLDVKIQCSKTLKLAIASVYVGRAARL